MYKLNKKQEKSAVIGYAAIWGIIGFVAIFLMAQLTMTSVFGVESYLPESYYQTVLITENASNFTEGLQIDSYIQFIKDETCHTIVNNATLEAQCQKL